MTKRNDFLFKALHVIVWIIFIGFCINAGALIVNFIFSLFNPEVVHNLYEKLDLSQMFNENKWKYFGTYSFILVISVLKAYLFYVLIILLMKLDLSNPFSRYVADKITKISYITFSIGLISYIAQESVGRYGFETDRLNEFWGDSRAYIFMALVIKVIALIFARGVELQEENDLTV